MHIRASGTFDKWSSEISVDCLNKTNTVESTKKYMEISLYFSILQSLIKLIPILSKCNHAVFPLFICLATKHRAEWHEFLLSSPPLQYFGVEYKLTHQWHVKKDRSNQGRKLASCLKYQVSSILEVSVQYM